MMDRLERSEGLGTIYPAMMNSIFALLAEGAGCRTIRCFAAKSSSSSATKSKTKTDTIRVQPCISPVWDTAIAMVSLEEAGLDPSHPALVAADAGCVKNQILGPGDWQVKNQESRAGRLGLRVSE